MLKQLSIDSFTLISKAEVPFRNGFTAITGETGAGKSVLLKALRLVCGDKAQASLVRSGESKAVVEALFDISKEPQVKKILDELEIDSDDELIIRREILDNGKGRARVNGNVVSQSDLQRLGEELVQMHGQSEQILLRDTRTHAQMLDDYAGNGDLLKEYAVHWNEWNRIQAKIEETEKRAKDLAAQKDFLKFQFDELQKAALKDGEEEELEERVGAASKSEIERRYLNEIQAMLGNEKGILDQARVLQSKILQAKKDPHFIGFDGSVGGKEKVLSGMNWAAIVFNGDAQAAIYEDSTLQFAIPKEGSFLWVDAMTLSSNAPNPDGAYAFMNYILDVKNGAQLAQYINYATPNKASLEILDSTYKKNRIINPPHETFARMEYLKDLGEAAMMYDEAWTTVKTR